MADRSLTTFQLKLFKIGACVVRHARAITFQLAEVAVTGPIVRAILTAIRCLSAPMPCAGQQSCTKLHERGSTVPSKTPRIPPPKGPKLILTLGLPHPRPREAKCHRERNKT
jgi:hypothetical protein